MTLLTANNSGGKVAELRYHPWGGTRFTDGATPTARRYTGQIEDAAIGLYFYNARYYDPYLSRFIQADTIVPSPANPQSLNRYAYTLNNPLRYTDPSGHFTEQELADYLGFGSIREMRESSLWKQWSSDWIAMLLSDHFDFGSILSGKTGEQNFNLMLVKTLDNRLALWDIDNHIGMTAKKGFSQVLASDSWRLFYAQDPIKNPERYTGTTYGKNSGDVPTPTLYEYKNHIGSSTPPLPSWNELGNGETGVRVYGTTDWGDLGSDLVIDVAGAVAFGLGVTGVGVPVAIAGGVVVVLETGNIIRKIVGRDYVERMNYVYQGTYQQ